jgi:hypothetical protein
VQHGGIGKDSDSGLRGMVVTELNGIVNDIGKPGMKGRFPVPGKGNDVGSSVSGTQIFQNFFQAVSHFFPARKPVSRLPVPWITAAFTVDAVKGTYLGVDGQQIDAQRHPQPAADDRSKNDLIKKKSGHLSKRG